ncbi:MAG: glycosyltransferase family 2 protein [Gammaproteobacteria bacterium]|nr:glycosyltransferase family 2 protein [Gammaproteobacteria bacterium]
MDNNLELSLVIPVFNGANSIGRLVDHIHHIYRHLHFEIVLINDSSSDDSEAVCLDLQEKYPDTVTFIHLSRNFGEHNAVLAGMNHAVGQYVAVLDDDGQNPPEEILKMLAVCQSEHYDVVYGHYLIKQHSWLRNLGSWFNGKMANIMLKKPKDLYLSSFKVMNRFVVDEVTQYRGAFPYIDGLVFRSTANIGQIDVEHRGRESGGSNYTWRKLIKLWMNMFLSYSIIPLRISSIVGIVTSFISVIFMISVFVEKWWINPDIPLGIPSILVTILFFAGIQLIILGTIGEYLGRLFLDSTGTPQYVVRYIKKKDKTAP